MQIPRDDAGVIRTREQEVAFMCETRNGLAVPLTHTHQLPFSCPPQLHTALAAFIRTRYLAQWYSWAVRCVPLGSRVLIFVQKRTRTVASAPPVHNSCAPLSCKHRQRTSGAALTCNRCSSASPNGALVLLSETTPSPPSAHVSASTSIPHETLFFCSVPAFYS